MWISNVVSNIRNHICICFGGRIGIIWKAAGIIYISERRKKEINVRAIFLDQLFCSQACSRNIFGQAVLLSGVIRELRYLDQTFCLIFVLLSVVCFYYEKICLNNLLQRIKINFVTLAAKKNISKENTSKDEFEGNIEM